MAKSIFEKICGIVIGLEQDSALVHFWKDLKNCHWVSTRTWLSQFLETSEILSVG